MPALSYSSSSFPFTPFTKIRSADVNTCFTDIRTLLNTTKLDSANIQNSAITTALIADNNVTLPKISTSGATAGQFIGYNGSATVWVSNPLTSLYPVVVGSAAQVTAGVATHSTIASAITAATTGQSILILTSYAGTENVSVNKKVNIRGQGSGSVITGTVTFTNAADYASLEMIRVTDTITLNSGADGIIVSNIWLATGKSFTDNGEGNLLTAIQET